MPIKVALADDHPLVAEGISRILNATPHIQVIATYPDGDSLLQGIKLRQPDVLLLDMQMPDKSGSELIVHIRRNYPDLPVLVLSGLDSAILVKNMIRLGCRGYLLKSTADKTILTEAIEKVFYTDELYLDPSLKEDLLSGLLQAKKKEKQVLKLSRREKEILELIVEEYSNPEIADKLSLSPRTVENHKYNLFQKLNVKNAVGLIKAAIQQGLLQ